MEQKRLLCRAQQYETARLSYQSLREWLTVSLLFWCKKFSLAEHLEPGAFTCRREFGLFQPFNGLDFNSSFHMLTNKMLREIRCWPEAARIRVVLGFLRT